MSELQQLKTPTCVSDNGSCIHHNIQHEHNFNHQEVKDVTPIITTTLSTSKKPGISVFPPGTRNVPLKNLVSSDLNPNKNIEQTINQPPTFILINDKDKNPPQIQNQIVDLTVKPSVVNNQQPRVPKILFNSLTSPKENQMPVHAQGITSQGIPQQAKIPISFSPQTPSLSVPNQPHLVPIFPSALEPQFNNEIQTFIKTQERPQPHQPEIPIFSTPFDPQFISEIPTKTKTQDPLQPQSKNVPIFAKPFQPKFNNEITKTHTPQPHTNQVPIFTKPFEPTLNSEGPKITKTKEKEPTLLKLNQIPTFNEPFEPKLNSEVPTISKLEEPPQLVQIFTKPPEPATDVQLVTNSVEPEALIFTQVPKPLVSISNQPTEITFFKEPQEPKHSPDQVTQKPQNPPIEIIKFKEIFDPIPQEQEITQVTKSEPQLEDFIKGIHEKDPETFLTELFKKPIAMKPTEMSQEFKSLNNIQKPLIKPFSKPITQSPTLIPNKVSNEMTKVLSQELPLHPHTKPHQIPLPNIFQPNIIIKGVTKHRIQNRPLGASFNKNKSQNPHENEQKPFEGDPEIIQIDTPQLKQKPLIETIDQFIKTKRPISTIGVTSSNPIQIIEISEQPDEAGLEISKQLNPTLKSPKFTEKLKPGSLNFPNIPRIPEKESSTTEVEINKIKKPEQIPRKPKFSISSFPTTSSSISSDESKLFIPSPKFPQGDKGM